MKPKYKGQISRTEGGIVYIVDMSISRAANALFGEFMPKGFQEI